jgi:hypothetical protein
LEAFPIFLLHLEVDLMTVPKGLVAATAVAVVEAVVARGLDSQHPMKAATDDLLVWRAFPTLQEKIVAVAEVSGTLVL